MRKFIKRVALEQEQKFWSIFFSLLSETLLPVANLLLLEVLIEYFTLTKHELKGEELHFYFRKSNSIQIELKNQTLSSKGLFPEATLQYIPLRCKPIFLHITRRRGINETTSKVVDFT
jgi:hypothetical protein